MENPNPDTSWASVSPSTSYGDSNNHKWDVFINHRGPDTKRTLASHLYHRLLAHGLRVFLDAEELQMGDMIPSKIKRAITTTSVHIAIFSPRYAESSWCLDELILMLESGSTIIPVFHHVHPVDLRWTTAGSFSKAWKEHEQRGRFDAATIEGWKKALSDVCEITGFALEDCNNDEGNLVNKIVEQVLKKTAIHYGVFINHRGPDAKKTLASHIYYSLLARGLRVFLDIEELQQGNNLTSQIKGAIRTAFVHIAIFSPGYADSNWCLDELVLMLESGSTIIPVFYDMKPSEFRSKYAQALCQLEQKQRFDNDTLRKWRKSLSYVADIAERRGFDLEISDGDRGQVIKGFDLEECDGDEGQLVDQVVQQVLSEEIQMKKKVLSEEMYGHPSQHTPPDLEIDRILDSIDVGSCLCLPLQGLCFWRNCERTRCSSSL